MKKVSLLLMLFALLSCRENLPPTCIITHPSHNAVFTKGENIPITVDADDPDGIVIEVKLYFNSIGIASFRGFPYSYELSTDEYTSGNYTITATVKDNSGQEATDEILITIEADFPSVTTGDISEISVSSANCGGDVVGDGGASVTARGVCWSTSQNPSLSDNYTNDGSGTGSYTSSITGLTCGITYYARAYATNSSGTAYGNQVSFTTPQCIVPPSVTTTPVNYITETSAQSGGNITDDGGSTITARGVCWSTSSDPTISNSYTTDGSGTGGYTSVMSGLSPYATYYVRAYATNSAGTAYGQQVSFKTPWDNSTIADYDGNVYNTIQIGDQVWMAENMKAIHYSNGASIPLVESTSVWDALTETDKAYCWYNNNSSNGNIYGALYTWAAIMNGANSSNANPSGVQGVCSTGWHLPSDAEWKQLEMYLGMSQAEANLEGNRGTDVGGKLKETGTVHWNSPNTGANNESGFTALPAGRRTNVGTFVNLTLHTELWTTTQNNSNDAWDRSLSYDHQKVYRGDHYKNVGLSVRCVKDAP